jgi:hypothetical protein
VNWERDPRGFRFSTVNFLAQHRTCRIGIQDEHYCEHPTTEEAKE